MTRTAPTDRCNGSADPGARHHGRRPSGSRAMRELAMLMVTAVAAIALAGCERPPIQVAEPPIRIETETIGSGPEAIDGMIACISYSVRFLDGRELMSDDETCLTVGGGNVIDGVRLAMEGMRAGGHRTVLLPPHTHWGSAGHGPVPPDTTLRLLVAVHSVHPPGWRPEAEPSRWPGVLPTQR